MLKNQFVTNPFPINPYLSEENFCGRICETEKLLGALENGRNITLISPRRMGKTGLIRHAFAQTSKDFYCFYVDLDGTTCLHDLVTKFGEEVLQKSLSFTKKAMKEISLFLKSLHPVFSADPLTGTLDCSLSVEENQEEYSLKEIFTYLESLDRPCFVAFDEFQSIAKYKEQNIESILRSYIQHLNNVHFIYAGSMKHIMLQMFTAVNRPFYQSTQLLQIDVIPENEYYLFSKNLFAKNKQEIEESVFHEIYSLVYGHTWYIQMMLNRLYQTKVRVITSQSIKKIVEEILEEYNETYRTYCKLITLRHKEILRAIACENKVQSPSSNEFIHKYKLGAASTINSAIPVLINKELLYEDEDGLSVYDKFFALWLRKR